MDFYEEMFEFDEQVEEFKDSLRKSVKREFLDEMARLKKENEELRDVKENFSRIKEEYEDKKREYERAIEKAESKAKNARIKDLLKEYQIILWYADGREVYGPRCGKCNSFRDVMITLPSGKKAADDCSCKATRNFKYFPHKLILSELADRSCGKIYAWYRECGTDGDEYFTLEYARSMCAYKNVVPEGADYSQLKTGSALFKSKRGCQKFCDYLNKKNGIFPDLMYKLNGERIS